MVWCAPLHPPRYLAQILQYCRRPSCFPWPRSSLFRCTGYLMVNTCVWVQPVLSQSMPCHLSTSLLTVPTFGHVQEKQSGAKWLFGLRYSTYAAANMPWGHSKDLLPSTNLIFKQLYVIPVPKRDKDQCCRTESPWQAGTTTICRPCPGPTPETAASGSLLPDVGARVQCFILRPSDYQCRPQHFVSWV